MGFLFNPISSFCKNTLFFLFIFILVNNFNMMLIIIFSVFFEPVKFFAEPTFFFNFTLFLNMVFIRMMIFNCLNVMLRMMVLPRNMIGAVMFFMMSSMSDSTISSRSYLCGLMSSSLRVSKS